MTLLTPSFKTLAPSIVFPPKTSPLHILNSHTPLYILPKVHTPNNPIHPIVSSKHSITKCISEFVDSHLHCPIPTFLHQSYEPFSTPSSALSPLPSIILLATIDVTTLYTNIPHIHGLSALKKVLSRHPPTSPSPIPFLLSLAYFILRHTISPWTHSIIFRLRGQPWWQGWPSTMIISSWDHWRRLPELRRL